MMTSSTSADRAMRGAAGRPAREFVRREVAPYLQEWEDAGEVPRSLHQAAAKQGLLGVSFPRRSAARAATCSTRSRCRRRSSRRVRRAG